LSELHEMVFSANNLGLHLSCIYISIEGL